MALFDDEYELNLYESYVKQAKESLRIAKAQVAQAKKNGDYYSSVQTRGKYDGSVKAAQDQVEMRLRSLEQVKQRQREAKKKAREARAKEKTANKTTSNSSKNSYSTPKKSKMTVWKGLLYFFFWPFLLIYYIFKLLYRILKFIFSLVFRR